jgi:capsular exopolysaccharide synthesis family protein
VITIGSNSTGQQDLRSYFRIFWRWKFLFLAIVVAIPVVVYVYERGQPRTYESSTLIELQDLAPGLGSTSAPVQSGNIAAVARLVTTTPVAQIAGRLMHPPEGAGFMLGSVSSSSNPDTGFVTINGQGATPELAAAIANAFASALGVRESQQAAQTIRQQIAGQVAQLRLTKGFAARATIIGQITQLRGLLDSVNSGAQVIQPAVPNLTSISPHIRRTVELSLVIAILLGIGAVLLAESGDRRLRNPDDLEKLTGWPLLAVIPNRAFVLDHAATPAEQEAFQMLRASMTYFNVEHPPASVAVVSPLVEDGKTTVAVGLAVATAHAGLRVILVDADLRRPQVTERLHTEKPPAGLADVLAGNAELDDVLVDSGIEVPEGGTLSLVPSGEPPPNPSGLLSAPELNTVLQDLEDRSDLVVIDTAAALAVSDALPLIQSASGVIPVVRMNRSSRAAVRRIKKVIASAQGSVLGVVATGSGAAAAGYGDYYGKRGSRWFRLRRGRSDYYARHFATNGASPSSNGAGAPAATDAERTQSVKDA